VAQLASIRLCLNPTNHPPTLLLRENNACPSPHSLLLPPISSSLSSQHWLVCSGSSARRRDRSIPRYPPIHFLVLKPHHRSEYPQIRMDSFNLHDYARPHDSLPALLWKVTHPKSQHTLNHRTGEMSARCDDTISDEASLKQRVSDHFRWSCREPSCFLSVFTNKEHARNWAKLRLEEPGHEVYITPIITAMLPATAQVFDATSLSERLGISLTDTRKMNLFSCTASRGNR
jgi:hypothetical protein